MCSVSHVSIAKPSGLFLNLSCNPGMGCIVELACTVHNYLNHPERV